MRTLASLKERILSLVVSPDGSTVVTASGEDVGFLDLSSLTRTVRSLEDSVYRLAWGPDGVVAGTISGEVWSVGRKPVRLIEAIEEEISGIAVAGDGTIAVCGGEPNAVAVFGPDGRERWSAEPYKWAYCVRFSPSGEELALATWDGQLYVLDTTDLPDGLHDGDTEYAGGPVFDAQFLPGGDVVVAGARFVRLWDRAAGRYTKTRELEAEALAIAVSPDGRSAIASTNDQQLRRYGLPDLVETGRFALGQGSAEVLSYFPEYAEFMQIKGKATVRELAFHPDGERVFGATEDGRIVEVTCAEFDGAAAQPGARRPAATGKKPAGKKPAGKKPAGKKPAGKKPAGKKPAGKKPARVRD